MSEEKTYLVSFINSNKYIVPVKASSKQEAADLAMIFIFQMMNYFLKTGIKDIGMIIILKEIKFAV